MKKEKDWFKNRGYRHVTNRTPKETRKIIKFYVSNPNKIGIHAFTPLIYKELKQRRYKKTGKGKSQRRSHKKIKNGVYISNAKIRPILYATHLDSHIYSYYAKKKISPLYENLLNNNKLLNQSITAYRRIPSDLEERNKNNIDFANDVFLEIKKRKNCIALVFDIENFFPSLNHGILKKAWCNLLNTKSLPRDHYNIFKSITRYSYIRLNDLKTKKKTL